MTDSIRFLLDGELHSVSEQPPTTTVLQFLRERLRRTGTKEGCAEGDCGACTVVVGEPAGGRLQLRAVNACIQFLPTLDGKALFTVESLSGSQLHPVQQAMVDCHGSQCGFCTPGFVMSLFALYKSEPPTDRSRLSDTLAGNLCRCTGYRPILDAGQRMYTLGAGEVDWLRKPYHREPAPAERDLVERLHRLRRQQPLTLEHGNQRYFAPQSVDQLAALRLAWPDACLLAGGTDIGLWVTKQQRDLDTIIYLGDVAGLDRIETTDAHLAIGAGARLTDVWPVITKHYPDFGELLRRFASPPIRNAGTLGGNVANGSPIGDSMPALLALDASLRLRCGQRQRELPLAEFYRGYRHNVLEHGEFIEQLRIPLPQARSHFRAYKISKRFDQDISAVCGAFHVELEAQRVKRIRICFGGMAAIPQRARRCEQALAKQPWSGASITAAAGALAEDFAPLSDMRASAGYRRQLAANLLQKFYLETTGTGSTRLLDYGRQQP